MLANYGSMAFSDASKKLQEKYGSRRAYARLEQERYTEGLTENEAEFIGTLDGFFLATNGVDGYPYVQYRGGPAGFLKVLDHKTLAFADFRGNRQYISTGNLLLNAKASLFLIDFASQTRLKILCRSRVVEVDEDPILVSQLMPVGYNAHPERAIVFSVDAFDWNCPQHITPRYTQQEIEAVLSGSAF